MYIQNLVNSIISLQSHHGTRYQYEIPSQENETDFILCESLY